MSDDLKQEIGAFYDCVDFVPGKPGQAPTGEPYDVIFGLGGPHEARAAFNAYAMDKRGRLYWRVPPEFQDGKFYMRLLISNKEPRDAAPE